VEADDSARWVLASEISHFLIKQCLAAVEQVQDLFVPSTCVWDERLVHRSFVELEAAEILEIKPGMSLVSDVRAWAFEKHGQYSVRSAYKLLKDEQAATAMAATVKPGPPGNANTGKRSGSWMYHRRFVFSGGGCCTIRCHQSLS
jgi:hypothetical protein